MSPPIYFILRLIVVNILFSCVATFFLSKRVYPAIDIKNLISAAQIFLLSV